MKLLRLLIVAAAMAIVACTTTSPGDLLTNETIAMKSVTAARQVATAALRAGKITVAEDQKTQADLTLIATGIKAAVAAQDAAAVAQQQKAADAIKANLETK